MSWEGFTTITHTNITVGAASTALAAANPNRRYLLIINRSAEMVDLKIGAAAVAGEGIALNPVDATANIQGVFEMSEKNSNLNLGAVNGICASGGMVVSVTEGS